MDTRLNEQSLAHLRAERAASANVGVVLVRYLGGLLKGDLGYSSSRGAPISELIKQNAPETLREVALGLGGAWLLALGLAIPSGKSRTANVWNASSMIGTGLLLSIPTALLAYLCLAAGARVELIFILALTPRIYRISRSLIVEAYGSAHVEAARARGIGELRILMAHVLASVRPQMLAFAATSVAIGIGAAIPIETICGVAGLGRLAWQAAMARDLLLLVNLTMLVALATTTAMAFSETMTARSVRLAR